MYLEKDDDQSASIHKTHESDLMNLFLSIPEKPGTSELTNSVIPTSASLRALASLAETSAAAPLEIDGAGVASLGEESATLSRLRGDSTTSSLSIASSNGGDGRETTIIVLFQRDSNVKPDKKFSYEIGIADSGLLGQNPDYLFGCINIII